MVAKLVNLVDGALPTHTTFDPSKVDANKVAEEWLSAFGNACEQGDVQAVLDLFWEDGFWRDMLPLTWSYRSLGGLDGGKERIRKVLDARLAGAGFKDFRLNLEFPPTSVPVDNDVKFVQFMFNFQAKGGLASGIARIIPKETGGWEAFTVFTMLESLHGVKERLGHLRERGAASAADTWYDQRRLAAEFRDSSPEVLIVGAGQSGLAVGAQLKVLGVSSLLVDQLPRVGDNWRTRYESLKLHDPVWYDHMPYLPFPPTWPVYTPAPKLGDWLENYAKAMDLIVWCSSRLVSAEYDDASGVWDTIIERGLLDGSKESRTLRPKHVVYACGLSGEKKIPTVPGADKFKGKILHSSEHGSGKVWRGRKAVVVGACTSAHDISKDFYDQGADVTMIQRKETYIMSVERGMPIMMEPLYMEGGPPTDIADRLVASFPNAVMKELHKRAVVAQQAADKELLDGLRSRGFALTTGEDGSGFLMLAWSRAGGYYLDVGASQYIVDGKIKLKSGQSVREFKEDRVVLEDGTELEADVVVFATGFGDIRETVRKAIGDTVADRCKPIWGLDLEREIRGVWTGSGVPNFWVMLGNLALCRFNSKLLALQIKAQIDGVFTEKDRCEL